MQESDEVLGYIDAQELDVGDDLQSSVLDDERGVHRLFLAEVNQQFFVFLHIQEQVVAAAPV